ncbi:flavoprotein [Micromonospora sp. DR5-3]|uniref:flavoprotein n=1 Tax=unclassified Micromonospora TaxID=2617518 RepID=UPI002106B917|nr:MULTISPECIES: flavoprotein [unclassified Micromonospora]MCW3815841.1 flavoprotein [Micromonospora sp. DR5-3]
MLALVVCAAPPVLRIGELIELLQEDGWAVCLTATPTAATWIDREALARQTGYPVRFEWRMPGDPELHPSATAVAVVPATFNVINKWAQGINDSLALGIINEALGADVPVYAFPNVKPQLAAHPSYDRHLRLLWKAHVITAPLSPDVDWRAVVSLLQGHTQGPPGS